MQSSHEPSTSKSFQSLEEFSLYLGKVTRAYPELANLVLAAFGPPSVADLVGLYGYLKALGTDPHDPYRICEPVAIRDFGTWEYEYACGYVEGASYYMRPLSFHLPAEIRDEITSQLEPGLNYEASRYADDLTDRILTAICNRTLSVDVEHTNGTHNS